MESSTVHLGFDLSSRDLSVRPGDDFNRYASGHWLDATVIPADRQSASGREAVYTDVQAALRTIVEADARDPHPTADAARIGRLYTSFLDESAVERRGAAPLSPDLTSIRAAADHRAVAALMGHDLGGFGRSLFRLDVYKDLKNPDLMVAYPHQDGLGLPTRAFYLDPPFAKLKAAYGGYVQQILTLAGWPDAGHNATAIVAFETKLAEVQWTPEQGRDVVGMYNPTTLADLQQMAPGFDWTAWAQAAGIPA